MYNSWGRIRKRIGLVLMPIWIFIRIWDGTNMKTWIRIRIKWCRSTTLLIGDFGYGLSLCSGSGSARVSVRRSALICLSPVSELYWKMYHDQIQNLKTVLRIRIRDPVPFRPRDPGWVKSKDTDPGSGMNNPEHIS
jgi:hypothetical protein